MNVGGCRGFTSSCGGVPAVLYDGRLKTCGIAQRSGAGAWRTMPDPLVSSTMWPAGFVEALGQGFETMLDCADADGGIALLVSHRLTRLTQKACRRLSPRISGEWS